jgi:hypothetical protein
MFGEPAGRKCYGDIRTSTTEFSSMTHAIHWQCHRNFRRLKVHESEKRDNLGGFSEGSGFSRAAYVLEQETAVPEKVNMPAV